jgi:hypothetical protein
VIRLGTTHDDAIGYRRGMTTPQESPDAEVTPGDATEDSEQEGGQVSDAQGAGTVSDGDSPSGDPDLAAGEQPDPGTEPQTSDDQDEE